MTNEEKQALIEHAKLWIANAEAMRDELPFGFDGDTEKELSLIKIALAALTAQPDDWQQRAEAAEVEKAGAEERCRMMFDAKNHWAGRARTAEAKLAELEKQEPLGFIHKMVWSEFEEAVCTGGEHGKEMFEGLSNHFPVYTRPAPAINLAELVPDFHVRPISTDQGPAWIECGADYPRGRHFFTRAAILRNIEEQK